MVFSESGRGSPQPTGGDAERWATKVITDDRLVTMVDEVKPFLKSGSVSTYLPELAKAKVDDLAVAIEFGSGNVVSAGDRHTSFTVQSVVKVFTLLLALHDHTEKYVFARVGREQTVGAFDSFETFGRSTKIPVNPFVNSGALTIVDMLQGRDADRRVARVLDLVRTLTGNPEIAVNVDVARSEFARSDRNRALCYFLRSCGLIAGDVEDLLWAYCQLCAIEVSVADLASAGRFLAADSRGRSMDGLPRPAHARTIRRLMLITGMYLDSGKYACAVGVPAKCGISGAMIGVVPGRGGIGIYGPALDGASNSIGGIRLMKLLSEALGVN